VRVIGLEHPADDRLTWLLAARRLAEAAGGIRAVAPLPRRIDRATPTTGFADVRTVALARLLLGDVPSVQVDWPRYGPKLAQVALSVGADDLDGVTPIDDPALGPRRAAAEDVRRNIVSAGLTPTERDGRWVAIER
jgi:aminodeoxyfutalosine synthase